MTAGTDDFFSDAIAQRRTTTPHRYLIGLARKHCLEHPWTPIRASNSITENTALESEW
jgi:hypothetical protein